MTKADILDALKLLSALEVVAVMSEKHVPDYLYENLETVVKKMTDELLKPTHSGDYQPPKEGA